jgi:predicted lipid-binding transport protein (Tim44 family)
MGRGFFGGLLGAGLFGLLLGHGLFGGFGGFFSLIGLLLQIGLIVLLVRFAIGLFRSRPSFAGMGGLPGGPGTSFRTASNRFGGTPSPQPAPSSPLAIETADFEAFEAILQRMQKAFSDEDVATLRGLSTPEMAAEFERELADNRAHGAVNRISDVRLLRGDLAESWREAGADFASAAMQFSLIDAMIDRASGRVVQGDANVAQLVTEVWTFTRSPASGPAGWRLAAIQQAG